MSPEVCWVDAEPRSSSGVRRWRRYSSHVAFGIGADCVAVLSTATAAGAQPHRVASASSYVSVIVPNIGMGGVKLGESLADVHKQLGGRGPANTGFADSGHSEEWDWGTIAANDPLGPLDALTVEYAWVNGKPGGASLLATPGAWAIAGTNIVSHKHGNVAALRSFYGKRLLGPYVVGPPTGKGGPSASTTSCQVDTSAAACTPSSSRRPISRSTTSSLRSASPSASKPRSSGALLTSPVTRHSVAELRAHQAASLRRSLGKLVVCPSVLSLEWRTAHRAAPAT